MSRYKVVICQRCNWVYPANAARVEVVRCARAHAVSSFNTDEPEELRSWFEARGLPLAVWVQELLQMDVHRPAREPDEHEHLAVASRRPLI